jgi:hypothetical protein
LTRTQLPDQERAGRLEGAASYFPRINTGRALGGE